MLSTQKIRNINCDCGNSLDRDENSPVNIMERFLSFRQEYKFLSHEPSVKEESFRKRLDLLQHTSLSPSTTMGDSALVVMGKTL
jgi:hypothetical protein